MRCSRLKNYTKQISKLTFRKFESSYHEGFWNDFEKLLLARTFMLATAHILLFLVTAFLKKERYDRYDDFVRLRGGPQNKEAAHDFNENAKKVLYFLYFIRASIYILSFKWPKLLKGFFYVEILVTMTEPFSANDLSLSMEQL